MDEKLITSMQEQNLQYILELNGNSYKLGDVLVTKSSTPMNKPGTRGGVYFSDKFSYRIKGSIHDLSIVPLLSKTMLGPNTEFKNLKITAKSNKKQFTIFANLTNTMQSSSRVELNMVIVDVKN